MAEITQVLSAALSADEAQRNHALQWLSQAQEANLAALMVMLADELRDVQKPPAVRQQAGLQLKNCLASREEVINAGRLELWKAFDPNVRQRVKQSALAALGTEQEGAFSAPQVVSTIAIAEIPLGMWPEIVPQLVQASQTAATPLILAAILETLGYICADVDSKFLESEACGILTAVITGMRFPQTGVKIAATRALLHSVGFCKANFDDEGERNVIMQTVCETAMHENPDVKIPALECLVSIMGKYYKYMEPYMRMALFGITVGAMHDSNSGVQLQGIEFWSSVCENEINLIADTDDAQRHGRPTDEFCLYYAKGALPELVPRLLNLMTVQDENDETDDWTVAKAAAVCLDLLSACVRSDILGHVVPFIRDCLHHEDWKIRDAAVQAFAAVLDGPDPEQLHELITQAIMPLLTLMNDPMPHVKDSLAWAIGRIFDLLPETIINDTFLPHVISTLLQGLSMEPRVADNVCWAFNAMAESAYKLVNNEAMGRPQQYSLSPYYETIVTKLFAVTERPDASHGNLRSSAFEALMAFLQNFAQDCYPVVVASCLNVISKLQYTLGLNAVGQEEMMQFSELQSLLCATLTVLVKHLNKADVMQASSPIMQILLAIFQSPSAGATSVLEDVLLAVSSMIEALEGEFAFYLESVKPFVLAGIAKKEEFEVCKVAIGVVGDLCRALGSQIAVHVDSFMQLLLMALADGDLDRSVKPVILSTFGDIAMAIGGDFQHYLQVSLQALHGASLNAAQNVSEEDEDTIDHMNELREGILEAYTGIVQALKGPGDVVSQDVYLLTSSVPHMLQFMECITQDESLSDGNIRASLGLLGDLCTVFGSNMAAFLNPVFTSKLTSEGLASGEKQTRSVAKWAKKLIQKLRPS